MFQFGEILTLAVCVVTLVYLFTNRGRIRGLPALRPLVGPFLLLAMAWTATVVEGIPGGATAPATIIFWQVSPAVAAAGGPLSELLNLVEHIGYAGAGVWLLAVLWRTGRAPREAGP